MSSLLNPAAEFDYNLRVRELFANLNHAGSLPVAGLAGAVREPPSGVGDMKTGGSRIAPTQTSSVLSAMAGSRAQGASVQLYIDVRDTHVQTVRYQAYGCPHFLAACESLAQWLEGQACDALSRWHWREVETELAVPAGKRSRLLLLDEVLSVLSKAM
jgi:NifU-like protein involved in Fe-S cluster formation